MKKLIILALLAFLFAPVHSARAQVINLDPSNLEQVREIYTHIEEQRKKLEGILNAQDKILDAVGEYTGIDTKGILFQGLMELACGKFKFPQIRLPNLPNFTLPDLPDSLCDWFGYGAGYSSNLWSRVAGSVCNSEIYVETVFFENPAARDTSCQLIGQSSGGGTGGGSAQARAVPVETQLKIRNQRMVAKQESLVSGLSISYNTMHEAGNAGAQMKKFVDTKPENLYGQMDLQNAILIAIYQQNAQMIGVMAKILENQGHEGLVNESTTRYTNVGMEPPPPTP